MQLWTGHSVNWHLKFGTLSPSDVEELVAHRTLPAETGAVSATGPLTLRLSPLEEALPDGDPGLARGCVGLANSASKFGAKS